MSSTQRVLPFFCELLYHELLLHSRKLCRHKYNKGKKEHTYTKLGFMHVIQRHTSTDMHRAQFIGLYESDSESECIIADNDKVFHEQGDEVHIKLALALSIAALQQKWMRCI